MKKRFYFILFMLVFAVYMIFFPDSLRKELIAVPTWALELGEGGLPGADEAIPFKLDGRLGYFTKSGKLLYTEIIDDGAVVSDGFFINYNSVSGALVQQAPDGSIKQAFQSSGTPFSLNDRLFVISGDQMSIVEYDEYGESVRSISPGSVITSMDAGDNSIVIGLLNGKVEVYTDSNEPVFSYFSTDSRYSVAYACAVTSDGKRLAAITGLYPQQLICFEYRSESYVPVFRKTIKDEYRRNIILNYSEDGRLLYRENRDGLEIFSTATFISETIKLPGQLTDIYIPGQRSLSFIFTSREDENQLKVFRPDIGSIGVFTLPAGELFFYPGNNCIYIGVSGRILRYDIIEG